MMKQKLYMIRIVSAIAGITILLSCHKDKPEPSLPAAEPTKWEVIPGNYKIYDTLGNYLYDMTIGHWASTTQEGYRRDTFLFGNLDGQFNVRSYQPETSPSNYPKYYIYLGNQQPIFDANNDRWQFFGYDAHYSNDSIYMEYSLQNILYYIEDARSYESRHVKVIGIRQP